MVFCRGYAKEIHTSAKSCPQCGATQLALPQTQSSKRILPVFLLCLFFGPLGIHRFFVGKIPTGVLQIVTLDGIGIWALVDLIIICVNFKDSEGHKINLWT